MRGSPQHRRAGGLTGVLVILIALAVSPRAFSQAVMSVSDIAAYSLEHNRQIKDAEKNLADARETISQIFTLDKSSLSLSSGYNYTPAGGAQDTQQTQQVSEHTVDIDGSVTVPIIPELSVSASLGDTFFDDRADTATASVRLAFNPFAGTQTAWKEWETLRKAEIQLANLKNSIPMQAEVAALNLLKGQLDLDSADRAMKLAERKYEIYQKRYDLDDITYSQLEEARTDANTSRQQYYNSMKSL
ncbi:MAG: TolC family protein, partial [Spirochaetales bacterium]|nr:TolC family protein [Spirochaetales bacterium]